MSKFGNSTKTGITLSGLLFLIFLILKLAEVGVLATWSWWWVFAPLWIPVGLVIAILVLWLIGYVIYAIFKSKRR